MADPQQFEYRWRSMDAFAHRDRPRVPWHFQRAEYCPPRSSPLTLGLGESIDHVLHHIVPGTPGDHHETHGPYVFWLYAQCDADTVVATSLTGIATHESTLVGSTEPRWHRLATLGLTGRVPRLSIAHLSGATVTCNLLLFTDDASFVPEGETDHVERLVYGHSRDELGNTHMQPGEITVGECTDLRYTYTCGRIAIGPGGGLRLRWPAKMGDLLQATDRGAPLFVESELPAGVTATLDVPGERAPSCREQLLTLRITDGQLSPGDRVTVKVHQFEHPFVIGQVYFLNQSIHWWTPLVPLATEVDATGCGVYVVLPEANTHRLAVIAKPASRLHVACRARMQDDKPIVTANALLDEHSNPVDGADVRLRWDQAQANDSGVVRGRVTDLNSGLTTTVNPIMSARADGDPWHVYFGDLHGHSTLSDGLGNSDDYYRHARNVAGLDFCCICEHICYLSDVDWRYVVDMTNRVNERDRFVTLVAYEWAGRGGHHCLYTRDDDFEPLRGMEPPCNTLPALWRGLADMRGRVFATTHGLTESPGLKQHWAEHDFDVMRCVEIYTRGGAHEYFGHPRSRMKDIGISYQQMLAGGARLGVIGGSDNHEARPGLTSDRWGHRGLGGLAGVWAPRLTRHDVFDAIYARHTYATTGQRTIVEFFVNGTMMGDATPLNRGMNRIEIKIHATSPLRDVEVIGDGQTIAQWMDPGIDCALNFEHPQHAPACYYMRLRQDDDHYAWSSPVFHCPG